MKETEAALSILSSLFTQLNARLHIVTNISKPTYHAGTVIASNYLITLAQTATQLLTNAGIKHDLAQNIIINLMQSSLENLQSTKSFTHSLTGPIIRGDVHTIIEHLDALKTNPTVSALYKTAGLSTLIFLL